MIIQIYALSQILRIWLALSNRYKDKRLAVSNNGGPYGFVFWGYIYTGNILWAPNLMHRFWCAFQARFSSKCWEKTKIDLENPRTPCKTSASSLNGYNFFFWITILNFEKIAVEGTKPQKFRKFSGDIFKSLLREDQNRSRKSENTLRNLSKNFKWPQFFFLLKSVLKRQNGGFKHGTKPQWEGKFPL